MLAVVFSVGDGPFRKIFYDGDGPKSKILRKGPSLTEKDPILLGRSLSAVPPNLKEFIYYIIFIINLLDYTILFSLISLTQIYDLN